jgi:hypothetical protein
MWYSLSDTGIRQSHWDERNMVSISLVFCMKT